MQDPRDKQGVIGRILPVDAVSVKRQAPPAAAGNIAVLALERVAGQSFTLYSPTRGVKTLPNPKGKGGADPQIRSALFDDGRPDGRRRRAG